MSEHDEATLANINKLLNQAVTHHQAGRLEEAEPLYVEALKIEPRIPDAQHFYGVLLLQSGRPKLALDPLQKAVKLNETQPAFRNNLGLVLKALGREKDAVEAFEAALTLAPDDYDARLNLGVTLQKMKRFDAAISQYEKAININPKNPAAYKNLGAALKQQQRIVQAIEVYSKALELQPNDADILINLGNALYDQNNCNEALNVYQRALELNPNDAEIHFYSGKALRKCDRNAEATAAYQSAIELEPQHAKAYFELGCIWHQEQNSEEAIRYYRIAIDKDSQNLDAMNNLGTILVELKQFEEAVVLFRRAIEIDENFTKAWNNLGNTLQEMGHTDEAIGVYERALRVDPNSNNSEHEVNDSQHDSGHSRIDDTWRHIYHQLSALLNAKGEKSKATAILQKWLKIDAGNPIAQHMLAAQTGENVPERASDSYIKEEFDQFAQTFDDRLKELEYRAPDLMAQQLKSLTEKCDLDILDAGCGTGLCGPLIRDRAGNLIGVDLSKGMLDKAKVRDCYDELIESELVAYLKSCKSQFDVVLSADTLNYFGNLTGVFHDTRYALRDGGWFLFTLEVAENEDSSSRYALNSHGRYSHPESYIRNELEHAGFRIHSMEISTLRKEAKKEVAGWIIAAQQHKYLYQE